eukprot:CAMPEP_0197823358 /NCGR_PEP_ID=MMETSP1437-20131217/700_1 /TAXON_ID=49252 ORGANISM="Eucampia antarctica, Strain CCMP1452" /NCGR_SAMPLE_ID=MMETSP1437 /ASSEMBLY_ACC=CAM_ASM_001096 /LENGTH=342 /DNA_ID=CAMNT_0043422485 /DNA_START=451 /DNA_END=1479 /DNA_ORIENTATION=-
MSNSLTKASTDLLLFALNVGATVYLQKRGHKKDEKLTTIYDTVSNSAFVFVKPHANTKRTQNMVRAKLTEAGISILSESDISGETIDEKKLIDQHYYAIASKATILSADKIPVPTAKFEEAFGEKWETVLAEKRAANAMDACKIFGVDANGLNKAWGSAKVTKFGGGFYCGLVTIGDKSLYVFNAFFMNMRSKFVGKDISIHCYEVQWESENLSWSSFRNDLLGPTDPSEAPPGSIRRTILEQYKELGISAEPNKGDNGVHASASPFEGLAEKANWLGHPITSDAFGKALLAGGLSEQTIKDWCVDPRVKMEDGSLGSIFDALEDMNAEDCLKKLVELSKIN